MLTACSFSKQGWTCTRPPGLRLLCTLPWPSMRLTPPALTLTSSQDLKPKSLDVRQEELGAMVDKEMAATSAAIEDAVRRIEVRPLLVTAELKGRGSEHAAHGICCFLLCHRL